jgi:DNA-binding NtrC family response regulator
VAGGTPPTGLSLRKVAAQAADDAERELVTQVLADTRWNRREAARRLKISYKALLNRLKRWEATGETMTPDLAADPTRARTAH